MTVALGSASGTRILSAFFSLVLVEGRMVSPVGSMLIEKFNLLTRVMEMTSSDETRNKGPRRPKCSSSAGMDTLVCRWDEEKCQIVRFH